MGVPIRVLMIEDCAGDAELVIRQLKRAGYDLELLRVQTAEDMQAALTNATWDLVLSDYSLPQFNAPAALKLLKLSGLDIPFIMVSGTVGEETAVTMMKSGANDYLVKDNLIRLVPAIERELREAENRRTVAAQLRQTLTDLSNRNRELSDFALVASHDLQEPLRKICTYSNLLLTRHAAQLDEKGRDFLMRSHQAAERMQALIRDLLSYTQVGSLNAEFQPVSLTEVVSIVVDDLRIPIEAGNAEVEVGALPVIDADYTQMRQLFQNLLSNALKFFDPVRALRVRVSSELTVAEDGPRAWKLVIEDNGIGFDEQHAEKIFAPFKRLHGREKFEGTGIGLAIVRRIVDRHLGQIRAIGKPGAGSRFEIVLPERQPKRAKQASPRS
jgi:signal transduction histidine kinase